jgi:Restriction endonuclease
MVEKKSDQFERQIERIHQLIEKEHSQVTWNDRLPDPDNPTQLRQIDITIEHDGKSTHIECRIHRAPQDVQWIEELIGRRISLKADAVIAVSSSGFTDGAIKKAKQFHIPLRTLQQLTDEEIRIWGRATSVRVIFYEFTDTIISFAFPPLPDGGLPYPITITKDDGSPVNWRGALEFVMNNLDDKEELDSRSAHFNVEIFAPLLVSGMRPTKIELSASVRRLSRELPLDMVLNYASIDDAGSTVAQVSRHDAGTIEILQSADDEAAFVSDMRYFIPPPNCLFHRILMDAGKTVVWKWAKMIELHRAMAFNGSIKYRFMGL